jgi:hypothetical protein
MTEKPLFWVLIVAAVAYIVFLEAYSYVIQRRFAQVLVHPG